MKRVVAANLSAGLILAFVSAPAWSQTATATVAYEVVGYGETFASAKADAVRTALQRQASQTVIAQREIEGDQLVKDSTLSTLQGHVVDVDVINASTKEGLFEVRARVTVSTKPVETYLAPGGAKASLNGAAVAAEVARSRQDTQARLAQLSQAFSGFPVRAVRFTVDRAAPVGSGIVSFKFRYRIDPAFAQAAKRQLAEIAWARLDVSGDCVETAPDGRSWGWGTYCGRRQSLPPPSQLPAARRWRQLAADPGASFTVCIDDEGLSCFRIGLRAEDVRLGAGAKSVFGAHMGVAIRFEDQSGLSTIVDREKSYLSAVLDEGLPFWFAPAVPLGADGEAVWADLFISTAPQASLISMTTQQVDLDSTTRTAMAGFIESGRLRFYDITSADQSARDLYDTLRSAR